MDNLKNLPPFYIGQKVVCIQSHSQNLYVKGKEYEIKDIVKGCSHYPFLLYLGIKKEGRIGTKCPTCNNMLHSELFLADSLNFKPKSKATLPLISLSKVIEQEKNLATAN